MWTKKNHQKYKNKSDFKSSSSSNKLASGKGPSGSPPRPSIVSYACQPSDFKCVSHPHTCVKASMVCDGIYDCTDHSDEFNCIVGGKASGSRTEKGSGNFKRWKKSRKTGQEVRSSLDQKKLRKRHLSYLAGRSFGWSFNFSLNNSSPPALVSVL